MPRRNPGPQPLCSEVGDRIVMVFRGIVAWGSAGSLPMWGCMQGPELCSGLRGLQKVGHPFGSPADARCGCRHPTKTEGQSESQDPEYQEGYLIVLVIRPFQLLLCVSGSAWAKGDRWRKEWKTDDRGVIL